MYLDEHIDLKLAINVSIINKSYKLGGLGHYTYTKMFMSGVAPILDYSSAMRIFLGVHKHAPNLAVSGDIGLTTGKARHHIEMIRLWNRLLKMPEPRLTHTIFLLDKSILKHTWSKNYKTYIHYFTAACCI